ncbi:MAG: hypothetical protein ABSG31_04740 [Tepidisphaeraceae bacterium]
MNRKLLAICILSVSAMALMMANFVRPRAAMADTWSGNRDYQAVTAQIQSGSEALYIVDNRTGLLAVFVYDPQSRALQAKAVRPLADAFR